MEKGQRNYKEIRQVSYRVKYAASTPFLFIIVIFFTRLISRTIIILCFHYHQSITLSSWHI